jgi:hypothetical protein
MIAITLSICHCAFCRHFWRDFHYHFLQLEFLLISRIMPPLFHFIEFAISPAALYFTDASHYAAFAMPAASRQRFSPPLIASFRLFHYLAITRHYFRRHFDAFFHFADFAIATPLILIITLPASDTPFHYFDYFITLLFSLDAAFTLITPIFSSHAYYFSQRCRISLR